MSMFKSFRSRVGDELTRVPSFAHIGSLDSTFTRLLILGLDPHKFVSLRDLTAIRKLLSSQRAMQRATFDRDNFRRSLSRAKHKDCGSRANFISNIGGDVEAALDYDPELEDGAVASGRPGLITELMSDIRLLDQDWSTDYSGIAKALSSLVGIIPERPSVSLAKEGLAVHEELVKVCTEGIRLPPPGDVEAAPAAYGAGGAGFVAGHALAIPGNVTISAPGYGLALLLGLATVVLGAVIYLALKLVVQNEKLDMDNRELTSENRKLSFRMSLSGEPPVVEVPIGRGPLASSRRSRHSVMSS